MIIWPTGGGQKGESSLATLWQCGSGDEAQEIMGGYVEVRLFCLVKGDRDRTAP